MAKATTFEKSSSAIEVCRGPPAQSHMVVLDILPNLKRQDLDENYFPQSLVLLASMPQWGMMPPFATLCAVLTIWTMSCVFAADFKAEHIHRKGSLGGARGKEDAPKMPLTGGQEVVGAKSTVMSDL
ncbi:Beta-ketoacyl-[acyl-carrier-protein] synthase I [Psidium guajava]|nr:Beta-ketoacyl-[acyl-carrier-protein] synthase I [Psidium guajava]